MGKIVKVTRNGSHFVMTIQKENGDKEAWTYQRQESGIGVSFVMTDREYL